MKFHCAGAWTYSENAIFLFSLLVYTGAWIRQIKFKVIIKKGRVYQNCEFHDPPMLGFLCYGVAISVIIVNMHYLLLYQHTTHWLLLYERIIMLLSYAIVDFYLFHNGARLICINEPFWQYVNVVFHTQVTRKACWPRIIFVVNSVYNRTGNQNRYVIHDSKMIILKDPGWKRKDLMVTLC